LGLCLSYSDSISDFPSEFKDSQDGAYDNGMQHSVGKFEQEFEYDYVYYFGGRIVHKKKRNTNILQHSQPAT